VGSTIAVVTACAHPDDTTSGLAELELVRVVELLQPEAVRWPRVLRKEETRT